ncbi:MAG: mechanosensitive ion channel domain-containing protein [Candidatus Zixiibacteriota bacterium]
MSDFLTHASSPIRILIIVGVVLGGHLVVVGLRRLSRKLMASRVGSAFSKARTVVSIAGSVAVFAVYFGALGLVLKEFGVSLTAYLASASIIGLALGFGSQGLVQDVVTGLTLVFSNLLDVGDMVEIAAQTGIVREIGMRFTVLENSFGAEVFIPNRTITNVVNYPRGYIRCLVDVTLSGDANTAEQMEKKTTSIVSSTLEQYPGILLSAPSIAGRSKTSSGKEFLRVKFRLWPGRGSTIETSFKQEIAQSLKLIDPSYADWMVTVNYEVEKKSARLGAKPAVVPPQKK